MIDVLASYDQERAPGVLARASLSVEDDENPSAELKWPEEADLRGLLLTEARDKLGIEKNDNSVEAKQRILDLLDIELDALSSPSNTESVLDSLSQKGELPSDLFFPIIIEQIQKFYGKKFDSERTRIVETVANPDRQQHYGAAETASDPHLVSLFSKYYSDKFSFKGFTLLIAGQRNGRFLHIHQVWRIYADSVDIKSAQTLVDVLKNFSDVYGYPIEHDGKKANFILNAELPKHLGIESLVSFPDDGKSREVTTTCFIQNRPYASSKKAALIIAVDLTRYRKALINHGW